MLRASNQDACARPLVFKQRLGRDDGEAFAIFCRRYADMPREGAAQRVCVGEAAMRRDLFWRFTPLFEQMPRRADASFFNPGRRRHPDFAAE